MSAILSSNQTPFPALVFDHAFHHGEIFHCAVLKATYAIAEDGMLHLLEDQPALCWNDQYYEEEGLDDADERTSVLYPSDLLPHKPRVDVLLVGHAHAPSGAPVPAWTGELRINEHKKSLVFTGPRQWRHHLFGGWMLDEAEPVSQVPLRYELAYGGSWPRQTAFSALKAGEYFPDNPLGRGFFCKGYRPDPAHTYLHPQILTRDDYDATPRIDHQLVTAGFSPLSGSFWTRLQKAGTYDDAWHKEQAPNIPLDMDLAFWNNAPNDQLLDDADVAVPASIEIRLLQLMRQPDVTLRLPDMRPYARVDYASGDYEAYRMRLDTILIDLDKNQLSLRWHYRVSAEDSPVSIKLCNPQFG